MSAQRYPEDYDAILAGAPANYENHLHAWDMAFGVAIRKQPGSFVSAQKLEMLNDAVIAACDTLDGVKDQLLTNPRQCRFDPSTLLCRNGDSPTCLTDRQVEAVKLAYLPVKTKAGQLVYPGYAPGSEASWTAIMGNSYDPPAIAVGTYRYVLHQDPYWDWRDFDLEKEIAEVDAKFGHLNAVNPNLEKFKARGGKLLLYHGWNDTGISPENTINYYSSVLESMGPKQADWMRLFMVPGMGHCRGGDGPDQFNAMAALERWKEAGVAPDRITAARIAGNAVDMTRPLCPYPEMARFNGVGSTKDAENFSCSAAELSADLTD
jgi:feruloyl esterase